DLRNNLVQSIYVRPKIPLHLDVGGNPLEPATQDRLTRSILGDFLKLAQVGVDTDRLFPIDLGYLEVDYPGVKALPTESIVLYGRAPTEAERATLAKLLPNARVEHRNEVALEVSAAPPSAPAKAAKKA